MNPERSPLGFSQAVLSSVGSMGNAPFTVTLWGGGVSFPGVITFVYADLVTIPVLNVDGKYYGLQIMAYILGVVFVTMAFTGFLMEHLFDALGIVPNLASGMTASGQTYFKLNYTFYLNLVAFALSGFLLYVYRRGLGAPGQYRNPVNGMRTDEEGPTATQDGETYHFCSRSCKRAFEETPAEYTEIDPISTEATAAGHDHH